MSKKMFTPRVLNQDLTQHSDYGSSLGYEAKPAFTQSFRGQGSISGSRAPRSSFQQRGLSSSVDSPRGWQPYPQPTKSNSPRAPSRQSSANQPNTSLDLMNKEYPLGTLATQTDMLHRDQILHSHQRGRTFPQDQRYNNGCERDLLVKKSNFQLDSDQEECILNSMLGYERVFYGGVDQVLSWYHLIKDSSHPSVAVLFTITGVVESMVNKEQSQVLLLKGESNVLQCLYHIIDRKLPQLHPSTPVVVTGNMTGARKLIMHDVFQLENEPNLERMSYLSDRAISRYASCIEQFES